MQQQYTRYLTCSRTHTVLCYVDNLLLYGTSPLISVPEVLRVLEELGIISGYKLNFNKSDYFNISRNAEYYHNLPFQLSANSFTYLGVKMTKSYYSLFKGNFAPLLEQCKIDMKWWSALQSSLIGRTNCKDKCFSQIIFVPRDTYFYTAIIKKKHPIRS